MGRAELLSSQRGWKCIALSGESSEDQRAPGEEEERLRLLSSAAD